MFIIRLINYLSVSLLSVDSFSCYLFNVLPQAKRHHHINW